MALTFTKVNAKAELDKLTPHFDKEIKKLEASLKTEKDKKKLATIEKNLKTYKSDRSKALGEKLAELQKANAKEAETLFAKIQNAAIQAGQMSGKAKLAFEALKKDPSNRLYVLSLVNCLNNIKNLPEELEGDAKAFVAAQGDLRNDGVLKGIDGPHAAAFKTLRAKLIDDNKIFKQKMVNVIQIVATLETLHKTGDALCTKFTQSNGQLRSAAEKQIGILEGDVDDITTTRMVVPDKCDTILRNRATKDAGILKATQAMGNELIAEDKRFRDRMKAIQTKYNAILPLLKKLTGSDDLSKRVEDTKVKIDTLEKDMKEWTPKIKETLGVVQAMKKKK